MLGATLLGACGGSVGAPAVHHFTGATMGSTYEVKFVGGVPVDEVRAWVEGELAAFDEAFSDWRPDSELRRCNAHHATTPFPVSSRFGEVLRLALDVAAATDGAFDPTVKPLSDLYRRSKREGASIDGAAAASAAARVGWRKVELRDGAVCKLDPNVQLDLDGLVAGAAADAIAALLRANGVASFYLQITGEVLCSGEKEHGEPWRIGVVDPASDAAGGDQPVRTLALRDRALCTSGDYRNATVVDGAVVHHVFDPRTGRSTAHGVVSASVLARSAAVADALGTACMVLGEPEVTRRWPALQQRFGADLGVLLLLPDAQGGWRSVESHFPKE
jgi:thiamine biosynthesis lipoprotein